MSLAEARYCARGRACRGRDPQTDRPQRLSRYRKQNICNACQDAEADADFEAFQRGLSVDYKRVTVAQGSRRAAGLMLLKEELVAQMLERRGPFYEAVLVVRGDWNISVTRDLPDVASSPMILYPQDLDRDEDETNAKRRWTNDLYGALLHAVPEECMGEEAPPFIGHPPIPARWAPWIAFASACALHDPPAETAQRFAEYGGLPAFESGGEGRFLEVWTEDLLREQEVDAMARTLFGEMVFEKAWEIRDELAGETTDYRDAEYRVLERHGARIWEEAKLAADSAIPHPERDHRQRYALLFDPREHTKGDVKVTIEEILDFENLGPKGRGRPSQGRLLGVMVRHLMEEPGWNEELIATRLGYSVNRVRQLVGKTD